MRKTREEKAITLIALIITIVVLLILAVVAINAVTEDGIIQHAVNAKEDYEKAQDEEQDVLAYYEQYLKTEGKTGEWIQEKTIVKNIKTGQIIEVGDYVDYKSNVEGYNDINGWRVLGVEDGYILLVSATNVGEIEVGYLNGISRLNEACKEYDDGNGALVNSGRSINVEDINRVTGYNPLRTGDGEIYRKGDVRQYLNKVTYTLTEENKIRYTSAVKSGVSTAEATLQTFTHIDGTKLVTEDEYDKSEVKDGITKEITLECNMYLYYPTTLTDDESGEIKGIDKGKAYNLLFADESNNYYQYWLASSFINTTEDKATFGLRQVYNNMVYAYNLHLTPNNSGYELKNGFRAVIALSSDVELNADGVNAWKMTASN